MNMVIGFGSTEQAFEAAEEKAFEEFVFKAFLEQSEPAYFTGDFHKTVNGWLTQRALDYRAVSDANDKAENHPDRYSYFHAYLLDDANYLIAVVKFMHINRRHALSPDGWGLMIQERLFKVSRSDVRDAAAQSSPQGSAGS